MDVPMKESFANAPVALFEDFRLTLGVVFSAGDGIISVPVHLMILAGSFVLFLLLAIWRFRLKKNVL